MATIKIPQSTAQIKVGGAAPTGSLALPVVQLSQVVGSGYKALGKVVEDIHKEQVTAENNAQFQEIVKKAAVDIERISSSVSKGTDVRLAIDAFEKLTKPGKWNELTRDKRKKVQTQFNQWLNKTKLTEYVSITKSVTANHTKFVKQSDKDYIDALTLKAASTNVEKADNAVNEMIGWFADPAKSIPYSIEEWEKFEQDTFKNVTELQIKFGARNNPDWTLQNRKEIEKVIGPEKTKQVIETAKLKIASNVNMEIQAEQAEIINNQDTKIANFTEILFRLQNLKNPDSLEFVPSLDQINDYFKEGKLNTPQYETLLKFYANPSFAGRDDIYDLINEQIFLADKAEEWDAIQRKLKLSPDYLMGLGIKDINQISSILDKAKDRQVFQDMKYYKTVLDDTLGKLDEGGFISLTSSEDPKADKKLRTKAGRLYNEYLDDGLNPDEAFQKVAKGFLLQQGRLPVIYDVAAISSIPTPEPSDADKKGKPEDVFDGWRNKVLEEYKNRNISLNEMIRDLDGLDVMEDIFKIRKSVEKHIEGFDAWDSSNSTGSKMSGDLN
tara:strand:+ start:1386 stop:3047 length:1662 start_codon:yes stop_codon:yes gene_type:complete